MLLFQVISKCEAISEFRVDQSKERPKELQIKADFSGKNAFHDLACLLFSYAYSQMWHPCDRNIFFLIIHNSGVGGCTHVSEGINYNFKDCHCCRLSPELPNSVSPIELRPMPHSEPAFYIHCLDSLCRPVKWRHYYPLCMNRETEAQSAKPFLLCKDWLLSSSKRLMIPAMNQL